MRDLVYDGSFDGFLCALVRALAVPEDARVSADGDRCPDLFASEERVVTDVGLAARFRKRFTMVAGIEEMETLLLVHASNDPRRHELLLGYARATRSARTGIGDRMGDPLVCETQKVKGRVNWEIGKLLGFARFRRTAPGFWYAPINPDANIVGFLGPHFADRFPDEDVLIHDIRRDIGYRGARGQGGLVDLRGLPPELRAILEKESEPDFPTQCQAYFERIAVPERRNPRLQAHNMPRRYWSSLIEKPGLSTIVRGGTKKGM
jgi:probable DNA metabolism protein